MTKTKTNTVRAYFCVFFLQMVGSENSGTGKRSVSIVERGYAHHRQPNTWNQHMTIMLRSLGSIFLSAVASVSGNKLRSITL